MTAGSGGPWRDDRGAADPYEPSLHRSAVMLTGAGDTGQELVRAALDRAGRRAGRHGPSEPGVEPGSPFLAAVVREYLSSSHHRVDRVGPVGASDDAGDVLESLRPLQRAAAVLVLVEGWSPERAAQVLGVPPRRVPSLVPATEGLADALRSVADHHCISAPGVTPERRPRRRLPAMRRRALLVVAAVAGLALLGVIDGVQEASRPRVTDPEAATRSEDLSGRGWVLGPQGDPPSFREGLRLIEVSVIDYASATEPLKLDTLPRKGRAMYAALWCDLPPRGAGLTRPTATLTFSGDRVILPCAGKHDDPALSRLVPLPPPESGGRVPVSLGWEGDLPGTGSAVLATYTEFGQNQPGPTPRHVVGAPPPVLAGAAVLDGDQPSVAVAGADVFLMTLRVSSGTQLTLWSGGTGTFMVLVDGVPASDDGDLASAEGAMSADRVWQAQDPELRDGSWTTHAPGRTRHFALPGTVRPEPGEERQTVVQVLVPRGAAGRWQLQASLATPVVIVSPVVPQAPETVAPDLGDRQLVAAWEVPVTGLSHRLHTPPTVTVDTVFLTLFPAELPAPAMSSLRGAAVHSDLGTVLMPWEVGEAGVADLIRAWPGWDGATPAGAPGDASGGVLGQVSVSLLGPALFDDRATVLAYRPRS